MDKATKKNIETRIRIAEQEYQTLLRLFQSAGVELYADILERLSKLDAKEGKLKRTSGNLGKVQTFVKAVNRWLNSLAKKVLTFAKTALEKLVGANEEYFAGQFELKKDVRQTAVGAALLRWGFDGKQIFPGSYLDNLFGGGGFAVRVASAVNRAISGGMSLDDFKRLFKPLFVSQNGYLMRHFKTASFDIFQRADRIMNKVYADYLGLSNAIYSGTLIETSRPFCIERVNKVYTTKQIASWASLEFQGKPQLGYDPFADCGGYNCRHHLSFISDELAEHLRNE